MIICHQYKLPLDPIQTKAGEINTQRVIHDTLIRPFKKAEDGLTFLF